uniref:Integrase catalytic domain-containing protein n=1 Tax=Peronospora matthiolae TaxID=2874970 RepID=A0AAV1TAP7_9STRA
MTPKDRLHNRYLVKFVDHKSNYCRVFLAPTKYKAAKKFEHFLAFFERQFDCRIHVLRTDGGGEYANVDLFCKRTGYAAYNLNRSPTSGNAKRASPIEVPIKQVPDLRDIVAFGSICSVYRDPGKNSLAQRAQVGVIIGRSDKIKGFRVFLQKESKVTITQHARNVETLSAEQNGQLQRALEYEDQIVEPAAAATSKESPVADDAASPTTRTGKKKSKSWTLAAHRKRGATKRAQAPAIRRSQLATTAWWLMCMSAILRTTVKHYAALSVKAKKSTCAKSSKL